MYQAIFNNSPKFVAVPKQFESEEAAWSYAEEYADKFIQVETYKVEEVA